MQADSKNAARGVALAVASLLAAPARGESPGGVVVTWSAPSQCPAAGEFQAQVERFLRQPLVARRDQSLSVAGEVREDGAQAFRLELRMSTAAGQQTRTLSHRDCRELAEAGALVTALAIDPNLVVEPPASRAAFPANAEPTAAPPIAAHEPSPEPLAPSVTRSASDRTSPQRGPEWNPSLVALGLAGNSVLPGVGVGVGARAAAGRGAWRLALRGATWLERFEPVRGTEASGITFSAWSLGLRACAVPVAGQLSLWACVGPDAGQLRGEGYDLDHSRTAKERWTSLNAELSLVYASRSGLMTHLGFELGKTLEAPRFGIAQNGQGVDVFAANAWLAQASVGFGFSFGRAK
jgi:hypothetical protein